MSRVLSCRVSKAITSLQKTVLHPVSELPMIYQGANLNLTSVDFSPGITITMNHTTKVCEPIQDFDILATCPDILGTIILYDISHTGVYLGLSLEGL